MYKKGVGKILGSRFAVLILDHLRSILEFKKN